MEAYAKWMEDGSDEAKRELAILTLMGLFDRPADAGCIGALLNEPAIPDITEPLVGLPEEDWTSSLDSLESAKLLTVNRDPAGALLSLDARARFWSGVQSAVVRWRQPSAVRPDGASPRSIAREILTTVWDGSPRLRSLETRFDALMTSRRPTITELVEAGRK